MEDNASRKKKLPMVLGMLILATGVWFVIKGMLGGSSLSSKELVALTNRGLASVELSLIHI